MTQETRLKTTLWKEHSLDIDREQLRVFMKEFNKNGDHLGLSKLFKLCTEKHNEFYDFIVERTDIPLFNEGSQQHNVGKKSYNGNTNEKKYGNSNNQAL